MDKINLFLSRISSRIQPVLNQFPILLRIKEWLKRQYFFGWRGRDTDVYLISYPKSGRTWVRVMLGKVICEQSGISDKEVLNTYTLTKNAGGPVVQFNHDGTDAEYARPYHTLQVSRSVYQGKKIILLTRDPRDLLVSNYYQATKRDHAYQGDLSSFVRSPRHGIKKIIRFYQNWQQVSLADTDLMHLRYEDIHQDPARALQNILDFIGLEIDDDQTIKTAVSFASFEHMKKMEKNKYFDKKSMRPGDEGDEDSYKVRKGKVGGYDEELSQEDLDYIYRILEEAGSPFYPEILP